MPDTAEVLVDDRSVTINGRPTARAYHVTLRRGRDKFGSSLQEVRVCVTVPPGAPLDNREFDLQPRRFGTPEWYAWRERQPRYRGIPLGVDGLFLTWKDRDSVLPTTQVFENRFSVRLQFGKKQGAWIPGQIYLCAPDNSKSWIAGSFTAAVRK